MQYGFVIDHDSCIGCHACTVACKSENDVPVGGFRTSVKYIELGLYPDVQRNFLVQRCNHCDEPPCVDICPVNALEKREDGIVDVDRDACIGCRACMQACPYDAIYLNEDLGAVEKCHFCAHRTERGLEPACVVVCPVEAIISGDFDDPNSRVAQMTVNGELAVRRPEQRTGPNVRYKGASDVALRPGAAERPPTYLWSDRSPHKSEPWPESLPLEPNARVVLDAPHKVEWGWPVSLYLVTKGIAAGAAMLAPFAKAFGMTGFAANYVPEIIAMVFLLITLFLLVEDLAKPMRFYRLLTRPNWKSWLVRGGIILSAFGGAVSLSIAARIIGEDSLADAFRFVGAILGIPAAGYTAFLFAQCKGRDLWESNILLPHLISQALLCGGVALLPFATNSLALKIITVVGLLGHALLSIAEIKRSHETDNARQGAAFMTTLRLGPFKLFRDGMLIGVLAALALLWPLPLLVFVPALVGLYLYEHAFIRAGQLPPLS